MYESCNEKYGAVLPESRESKSWAGNRGGCLEFLKERDGYLNSYMHFRVIQSDMMADMRESFVQRYNIEVE